MDARVTASLKTAMAMATAATDARRRVGTRPEIKTLANLESAFDGESMAHIKYRYFAKLVLAPGAQAIRIPLADDAASAVLSVNAWQDFADLYTRLTRVNSAASEGDMAIKKRIVIMAPG